MALPTPRRTWCHLCYSTDHFPGECQNFSAPTTAVPAEAQPTTPRLVATGDEPPGLHRVASWEATCRDPGHNFPSHLYVPPRHKYVHYCPSCHHKSVVHGIEASL